MDGDAAWALARAEKVDLVLLDITLTEVSGVQLAKRLRSEPSLADIRIALHTGLEEATVRRELADYDLFVKKSEDPERLLTGIAAVHSRPRASHTSGDSCDADGSYSLDDVACAHRALRKAMGLEARSLDAIELAEMLRPDIEQLLELGKTCSDVLALVSEALGRDVSSLAGLGSQPALTRTLETAGA